MSSDNILEELYELTERLGTGQYGEVWEAYLKGYTDDRYAVKIFKKMSRSETVNNELKIMKELQVVNASSRNLVDVIETDISNKAGRRCLVLEYLAGKELFDRIVDKGHFSERDAALTIASLAKALSLLHSKCIMHRDLKPENIVYRSAAPDADPVIVDFGFAKIGDEKMPDGSCYSEDPNAFTPLGTHGYISPESYERCLYSSKSDIWALGCITYTILVGFPPFDSKDRQLSLRTRRGKYYPLSSSPWKDISEDAKDLVRRMLCVDRHERLSADEILEHHWLTQFTGSTAKAAISATAGRGEAGNDLGQAYVERLQRLQSKSKFKKAINAVVWSLRLKKVAVKNAIGQAKEEERAIRDASPPVKESARKKLPSDGEAKEAITEAHSLASEEKSENGEEGSLDENLNMTIDQIQRLASGLMSTATHNVGSRANSTHITSPTLISKKTISSGGHAVVVLDGRSDPVESKSSACDPPSPLMLGANEDSTRHAHEETDPVSRDNVLTNTGSAANVRDYSDTPAMKRMSSSVLETFKVGGGVNYDEFCRAVNSVGMPILATKHVFDVFDQSGTGIVSVSEFMSTMVAFRVDMLDAAANAETDEEFKRSKTRFLFNIFDLDGSGMISRSELHHVIGVLLSETGEQDLEKIEIVRRHRVSNAGGTSPMRSSFTSPSQENQNTNSSSTVTASSAAATSPGRKHGCADGLRDSSAEVLLDFHPEHTNNILIGNEGIEIDINSLFDSIDTDGSGEISFSEFEVWYEHGSSQGLFSGLVDDMGAVQARFRDHFGAIL